MNGLGDDSMWRRARRGVALANVVVMASGVGAAGERLANGSEATPRHDVVWTMVDVTAPAQQGDAHVIESGDNVVLIDAGTYDLGRTRLVPLLEQRGIDELDAVFVTHAHRDHYGGVRALLEAGLEIDEVELSMPDDDVCEREVPWGCDKREVEQLVSSLERAGVPVDEPNAPDTWDLGDGASLELVERLDGDHSDPAVGTIDVNDTSMIMRLDVDDTSVLFTGDLNHALGTQLATRDLDLQPTVLLKVPHHGTDSLAPEEFFAAVHPDAAFVPSPTDLWCSDRSARPRTWLSEHDVPTFVSGQAGNVTVHLRPEVSVRTERATRPC